MATIIRGYNLSSHRAKDKLEAYLKKETATGQISVTMELVFFFPDRPKVKWIVY